MLKVEMKLEGVDKVIRELGAKKFKQAARSTLDKTATFAKKTIVDDICTNYNLNKPYVNSKFSIIRTTQNNLVAMVKIVGEWMGLIHFNARQAPKGVIANIQKGKITFRPHAFIQTMKGSRNIWTRLIQPWPPGVGRGKKGMYKGVDPMRKQKLAVKRLVGPSVAKLAEKIIEKKRQLIEDFKMKTLRENIEKRGGQGGIV